jgi:hypothetical protein
MKKLLKLLSLYQATKRGYRYGPSSPKTWKRAKWKERRHTRHGGYGYPPPPHGYEQHPYGHHRSRGLKGMLIDVIVRKLLKHR